LGLSLYQRLGHLVVFSRDFQERLAVLPIFYAIGDATQFFGSFDVPDGGLAVPRHCTGAPNSASVVSVRIQPWLVHFIVIDHNIRLDGTYVDGITQVQPSLRKSQPGNSHSGCGGLLRHSATEISVQQPSGWFVFTIHDATIARGPNGNGLP